jgi:hypothetical protein
VEPNKPKLGKEEDPAIHFPPKANIKHMLRYRDHQKKVNTIKLDQHVSVDKPSGYIQEKRDTATEDPHSHIPSIIMSQTLWLTLLDTKQ